MNLSGNVIGTKTEPVVPAKQANRLLAMLDETTTTIGRHVARIDEALVRLAGHPGPVAVPQGFVMNRDASVSTPGTLGYIDDKLAELRAEADRLAQVADRLETIA